MISLIIPIKNEAKTIKGVILKAKKYVDEIIVIDGHSIDNSIKIVKRIKGVKVFKDNGKGKGGSCKIGN